METARACPLLVTESAELRQQLFEAQIALALAHKRRGDVAEARDAMAELVRSFPDKVISFKRFGPEPAELRTQVEADLRAGGTGRLVVTTPAVEDARIYLDERFVGAGPSLELELFPGSYRIFVVAGGEPSRLRHVEVESGDDLELHVDTTFDAAFRAQPIVALAFADEPPRARLEVRYAADLARMAGTGDGAVIIGLRERAPGRPILVGRVIAADGTVTREAFIDAAGEVSVNRLQALAAYLDGDDPTPDIHASTGRAAPTRRTDRAVRARFRIWKWIPIGAGAFATGSGAALIYLDGRGTCDQRETMECPKNYRSRQVGAVYLSIGLAAVATGALMWWHDRRRTRKRIDLALVPEPGGVTLGVVGGF